MARTRCGWLWWSTSRFIRCRRHWYPTATRVPWFVYSYLFAILSIYLHLKAAAFRAPQVHEVSESFYLFRTNECLTIFRPQWYPWRTRFVHNVTHEFE